MTMHKQGGFTIIEVVLFLAITGGLFAALMIGVNMGITQQRYLDSVRSYKSLVQSQYAAVLDTRNENDSNKHCDENGAIQDGQSSTKWGASSCVILGRAILIPPGGATVKLSSVTAKDVSDNPAVQDSSDTDIFTTYYKPQLADFDEESVSLDWDSKLTNTDKTADKTIVILILRSPVTGLLSTFVTSNGVLDGKDLKNIITQSNSKTVLSSCIENESTGLLPKQMVKINPIVASADAVVLDGGQNTECQ